jgi:cell division protease FtsH
MMVEQMGMSDVIGPRNISGGGGGGNMFQASPAGEGSNIKNKADAEIDRILKEQYERGMKLLTENRPVLDLIANALVEKEKITGTEMLSMIRAIRPDLVSADAIAKVQEFTKPVIDALSPP